MQMFLRAYDCKLQRVHIRKGSPTRSMTMRLPRPPLPLPRPLARPVRTADSAATVEVSCAP